GTLGLHIAAILLAVAFTSFISPQVFFCETGSATRLDRIIFILCKYVIPVTLLLTIAGYLVTGVEIPGTSFIPGTLHIGPLSQVVGVSLIAVLILVVIFIGGKLRK
ncbi:MAG: sodium-dependent transporter, partial [Methanoregula sp.]|nr:sodium-dependent transporter [Methanoregula sp.]